MFVIKLEVTSSHTTWSHHSQQTIVQIFPVAYGNQVWSEGLHSIQPNLIYNYSSRTKFVLKTFATHMISKYIIQGEQYFLLVMSFSILLLAKRIMSKTPQPRPCLSANSVPYALGLTMFHSPLLLELWVKHGHILHMLATHTTWKSERINTMGYTLKKKTEGSRR